MPVKFQLEGDLGLDVLFGSAQVYECGTWPFGASEDATATGADLRYDPIAEQYVFTWKTLKEWAGTCQTLVLIFDDGTYATASFDFTH